MVAVLLSTTEISNPSGLPSLEIKDFIERERAFDSREKLPELFELKSLPDLLNSCFQTRKKLLFNLKLLHKILYLRIFTIIDFHF